MNYIELLEQKRQGLAAVLASLQKLDRKGDMKQRYGETLTAMRDALQRLDGEINNLVRDPAHVDMPAFVKAYVGVKGLIENVKAVLPAPGAAQTATQKTVRRFNDQLDAAFKDMSTAIGNDLVRCFNGVDMQRKMYVDKDTFDAEIASQKELLGLAGRKPTMDECTRMTLSNADPMRFFSALIWLSRNEASFAGAGTEASVAAEHPFHKAFERMKACVAEAPLEKQARLAQLLIRQEVVTGDAAADQYEQYLAASLAHTPEDKKTDACANLSGTEAYRSFESLKALRDSFDGTLFASLMDRCSLGESRDKPGIGQRNKEIRALASGGMKTYLAGEEIAREAAEFRKNVDRGVLKANGSAPGGRAWENYDLYNRMRAKHTDDASESYRALERTMGRLADEDPEAENKTDYLRRLREAEKVSRAYLDSHRKKPWSDIGKERVALAKELHDYAQNAINVIEKEQIERSAPAAAALEQQPYSPENNTRIMRLQRVIGTTHINPPKPVMHEGISNFKKSGAGHVLYGAVHWLVNNTVGRLWELATLPWSHYNTKKVTSTLNTNLIPGENGQEFEKIEPDALPDDQPMITDLRRVPLVWEQPIPDDPNQPPTVTLEVEQAREGEAIGSAAVDGKKFSGEMGHAFIRLNYTKKDPITGQPQRFRTSFGFYPKGGFVGPAASIAMYTENLMIPGQLKEDNGHAATVGKTFELTNKQFNKIVLAAQAYEKDGYNYFNRNCTTFVRDVAKEAGLDVDGLFKQVDLTSDTVGVGLGALGSEVVGLAAPIGHFARRDIVSKAGKDDYSYQRFGQKMLNVEDVERFEKVSHHLTGFYSRAKGYAPGHAGESIRHDSGFRLHSMDYEGSDASFRAIMQAMGFDGEIKDYKDSIEPSQHYPAMIGLEFENLRAAIRALPDFDNEKDGEILERFGQLHKTFFEPLKSNMNVIFDEFNNDPVENRADAFDVVKSINHYIEGLDEIWHDSFKGDPRLNIPFQHFVSVLEHTREAVYEQYQSLYTGSTEQYSQEQLGLSSDGRDLPRMAVEMFNREVVFKTEHTMKYTTVPAYFAAGVRVTGSVSEFFKFVDELKVLEQKKKDGLTGSETAQLARLNVKKSLIEDFTSVERRFCEPHQPTEEEIRIVFKTLPDDEKENGGRDDTCVSDCYQTMILDNLFNGLLPKLRALAQDAGTDLGDLVKVRQRREYKPAEFEKLTQEEKDKAERAQAQFDQKKEHFKSEAAGVITRHIAEKLEDPETASMFRQIMEYNATFYAARRMGPFETLKSYQDIPQDYMNGAQADVYRLLTDRYINLVCAELALDRKTQTTNKAKIKEEARLSNFFTCSFEKEIFPAARELQERQDARDAELLAAAEAEQRRLAERRSKQPEPAHRKADDPAAGRRSVAPSKAEGIGKPEGKPVSRRNSVGAPSVKPTLAKEDNVNPEKVPKTDKK